MSRQYHHIEEYSEETLRLKAEGKTRAEIGKQLGFVAFGDPYGRSIAPCGRTELRFVRRKREVSAAIRRVRFRETDNKTKSRPRLA